VTRPVSPVRAVVFDCDGVLFDSLPANIAYYNAIRAALGLAPMDAAWEERAHFLAASSVIDEMFGHDAAVLAEARRVARATDYGPFYDLMAPAPGVFELLGSLRLGWRLGMASNRGATLPEVVRRFGLDAWLDASVGVLDVARPKPHPDMIHECLVRLDVPAAAAIYVGDSPSDLAAARAAGVQFVAVGDHAWAETHRVRELRQLPAILDRVLPLA
jgi:phosphoglycolate phosphatase